MVTRRDFIKYSSTGVIGTLILPSESVFVDGKEINLKAFKPQNAKFVWYDTEGQGRNLYAKFRKTFAISSPVQEAKINVFADSSYQIFVNGKFLVQGPVRFDPRYPVHDSIDLKDHLKNGKNVIAIRVNYFGSRTYKSILNRAGLVAWGNISTKNETITLDTPTKGWKGIQCDEHTKYARKISFALNQVEVFEQSPNSSEWKEANYNDSAWPEVVVLKKQDSWGAFEPRSIPFMSGKPIPISKILSIAPLEQKEDFYSFSLPIPHYFEDNDTKEISNFIAFYTWIHSEKDQTVTVGAYFGENWVNGELLPRGKESLDKSLRINQHWKLKKGWNYFFGKVGGYFDILDQYYAFPKGKGITLSADKDLNSKVLFRRTSVISQDQFNQHLKNKSLPFKPEDSLKEIGGWVSLTDKDAAYSPCRETSWDNYGEIFETVKPEEIIGKTFSTTQYPEGFSILMDLDYTKLLYPTLEVEGVKGAIIDLTYSEKLTEDNIHLYHNFNYCGGDRIICNQNKVQWIPNHPKGMKYLKITVRNTSEDVKIKSLDLISASYPTKRKGYFTCSDPLLNEIWLMGERTLATNMEDAYVDCVGRERGMYGRDTIIQYYVNLATFGDQALMNRCLQLYGQSPDSTGKFRAVFPSMGNYTIADFSLELLEGYKVYYDNTGDKNRISKDWDAIVNNLQWFHKLADERQDLLLDSDWHKKQQINAHYGGFHGDLGIVRGHMDNSGIHCVFSITYLIALQNALSLAKTFSKKADAANFEKRIKILTTTIPASFWDEKKKCFSDNLNKTSHSVHANLFAIRAGIVNKDKMKYVKDYIAYHLRSLFVNGYDASDGTYSSPSFAFYLFDGLYKAGLEKVAENIMKQGWGWALNIGLKTTPEYFNLDQSLCHAWSASPTYFLSKYVLGINFPQAPNLNEVEIKVQADGITDAHGTYPHPNGLIEVKWHMESGKRVFDLVKGPENVNLKIIG